MKNDDIRSTIIKATMELIEGSDGDINNITAGKITDKCGVALGLINYHFGSKENLIAECCRQIINEMLNGLGPDRIDYQADDGLSDRERLILYARQTFDYLYSNPSIVKISILSDLKNYKDGGNSALTVILCWYYQKKRDPLPIMVGHVLIDMMTVSWILATSLIPGFYETMCNMAG